MQENEIGGLLKKINTITEKKINRELSALGITFSQYRFLRYLNSRGGKGILFRELEQHFDVSQPTVTGIVKRLSAKNLVFLEKYQEDPHFKTVNLTEKGRSLSRTLNQKKEKLDEDTLAYLNEEEIASLQEYLTKVYESLKNS